MEVYLNPKNRNHDLLDCNQGNICLNMLDLLHFNYKLYNFAFICRKIFRMLRDDNQKILEVSELQDLYDEPI